MGDDGALPDGALGEHIRLALQIAVLVQNFKGTEQAVGRIIRKGHVVAAAA